MTATPTEIQGDGPFKVAVEFVDGERKYGRVFEVSSLDDLKARCEAEESRKPSAEAIVALKAAIGSPLAMPSPTAEDPDRLKFMADCRTLQALKRAAALGLIPQDDAGLLKALESAKASYKPEYAEIL